MNFMFPRLIGPLLNQQRWDEIFWLITACPAIGVAIWLVLSRDRGPDVIRTA